MKTALIIFSAALPLALAGCAGTDPKAAFNEVQTNISARTGGSVQLSRNDSSHPVAEVIAPLLKTNLTAETAVAVALLNNRSLQAQFAELGISQADVAQASRLHNIEIAGSWRIPNRPPSAVDTEYSVAGDLLDLLTLPARKKIAARNLEQTKLQVADKVLQLAADTETAFYQLQAQMEFVKHLNVIVEVNELAAEFAQRQYDAGNLNELEWHSQQAPAMQSHLDALRAQATLQMDRERLNRLLGLSGEQIHWQIADELPPLPANEPTSTDLESLAVRQRLDLAAARSRMESIAAALRLKQHTRWIPGASVGVDTERTPDGQRVTGPTLDLEIPLFDQGQPAVAKLAAELQQAKDNYAAQEVNIRSEVRSAQATLAAARAAVEYSQKNLLPLRQKILDETLLHYNAMRKSSYELLLAKEREQMAEQGGVEALRDYWVAQAELARAVGGRSHPDPERSKP